MADTPLTAVMVTFDDTANAKHWLQHVHDQEYKVVEGIIIERDENGKVHQHLANLPGLAASAGVGAVIAAILTAIFPPLIIGEGLAILIAGVGGAAIGAGTVAIKDEIVDRNAFKDMAEALEPGQSALIVAMRPEDAAAFTSEVVGYNAIASQEINM